MEGDHPEEGMVDRQVVGKAFRLAVEGLRRGMEAWAYHDRQEL